MKKILDPHAERKQAEKAFGRYARMPRGRRAIEAAVAYSQDEILRCINSELAQLKERFSVVPESIEVETRHVSDSDGRGGFTAARFYVAKIKIGVK